jgi:hypothetical protein
VPMPLDRPTLSRRTLLRWSSVAVGGFGITTITACGASDEDAAEPDPLEGQASRARTDAAIATVLVARTPELSAPLTTLEAEIARMEGATTSFTPPSTTVTTPAGELPTVGELRERLNRSQREAADLARTLSGYRAGLLASISASCAVQTAVMLP